MELSFSVGMPMPVGSSARTTSGSWLGRARDGGPLPLAARQRRGQMRGSVREPDLLQQLSGPPSPRAPGQERGPLKFSAAVSSSIRWKAWKTKPVPRARAIS